jgi:CubicO group peptidase (beta-lactamase class C family)
MAARAWLLALALWSGCAADPPDPFDDAFNEASRIPNLTSLSVHQNGALVREAYYFRGNGETLHDVRSVTKTVTSLLIGAAIDAGCVASLDQPIGALLGDQAPADPAKAMIEVRDLLSMTSGFDWLESGALGYNDWIGAPDQVDYVLARSLVAPRGTTFNYNSGAFHLLSAILTHACAPTAAFADQHLFGPLGIPSPPWETDSQGLINGASGLELTTPQLAAIGQLILDRGQRDGVQIVSAAYVDAAMKPQIGTGYPEDGTPQYGFGVWLGDKPSTGAFGLAEGFGGQFIAVMPDRRAVVVATTRWDHLGTQADDDFVKLYHVLVTQLLPAL